MRGHAHRHEGDELLWRVSDQGVGLESIVGRLSSTLGRLQGRPTEQVRRGWCTGLADAQYIGRGQS